jgi:hypothetical protein
VKLRIFPESPFLKILFLPFIFPSIFSGLLDLFIKTEPFIIESRIMDAYSTSIFSIKFSKTFY